LQLPALKPSDTSVTFGVLHASAIVTLPNVEQLTS